MEYFIGAVLLFAVIYVLLENRKQTERIDNIKRGVDRLERGRERGLDPPKGR